MGWGCITHTHLLKISLTFCPGLRNSFFLSLFLFKFSLQILYFELPTTWPSDYVFIGKAWQLLGKCQGALSRSELVQTKTLEFFFKPLKSQWWLLAALFSKQGFTYVWQTCEKEVVNLLLLFFSLSLVLTCKQPICLATLADAGGDSPWSHEGFSPQPTFGFTQKFGKKQPIIFLWFGSTTFLG